MQVSCENIISLVDYIKIDTSTVICHFKCPVSGEKIVSAIPFEPYDGKILLSWQDWLFHPRQSYEKFYHTPIVIYAKECEKSIILKAFAQVSSAFVWDEKIKSYKLKESKKEN
jgi:hypothetical protein